MADDGKLTLTAEIDTSNFDKGVADIKSGTESIKTSANQAGEAVEDIGDGADKAAQQSTTLKSTFSDALDGISGLAESVGVKLPGNLLKMAPFAALAAGVGSVIVSGITTELDKINLQGTLEAKLGHGTDAAKNAGKVAGELYNEGWGESLDDIGNTVATVSQAIRGIGEDDLKVVSGATEMWSTTFDTDVSEGVRGVKVLMEQFGLSAQDATDLMTQGMQNGLNYTGELADNLSEYSGRWAEAGTSAQDYFSLLQAGVDNGAYSLDKVGDFLNEFLTSLSDGRMEESIGQFSQATQDVFNSYKNGGATAQDVLNAVIGEMNTMTNETDRASIASTLWSSLGEDNAWGMIGALAGVTNSYGDISGATAQAMDDSKSLSQQFDSVMRTMSSTVGSVFAPVLQQVVSGLGNLATGFQTMLSGVDLTPLTNMVTGLFSALTPLGGIITNLASAVMPIISAAISAIIPIISTIINVIGQVVQTISSTVTPVIQTITQIIQTAMPIIQGAFQTASDVITGVINATFPVIQTIITSVMNIIQSVVSTILAAINGDWDGVWNGILSFFVNIWNLLANTVKSVIQSIKDVISTYLDAIKNVFSSIWNAIGGTVTSVWNSIKSTVSNAINNVKNTVSNVLNSVKSTISNIIENIKNIFSNGFNAVRNTVSNAFNAVSSTVSGAVNNVINFVSSLPSRIAGIFGNAGSLLVSAGRNIINGLINGITGAVSGAVRAVKNAVSSIVNGAKSFLGIHSPSTVFRDEIGQYIPEGVAVGIEANTDSAIDAVHSMTDDLVDNTNVDVVNTGDNGGMVEAFLQALSQLPEVRVFRDPKDAAAWVGKAVDEELAKRSTRRKVFA